MFPLSSNWRVVSWGEPKQGEVVVFNSPEDGTRLVKRCIAGPGDTIEVRANHLLVNGVESQYAPLDPKYRAQIDASERAQYRYWQETMPGGRVHPMVEMPGNMSPVRTF